MDTLRELTAAEVRAAIARQRTSAAAVARTLGWSQGYVARRVDGRVALNMDDLEAIAGVLGLPVTDLLPKQASEAQGEGRVIPRRRRTSHERPGDITTK